MERMLTLRGELVPEKKKLSEGLRLPGFLLIRSELALDARFVEKETQRGG